MSKKVVFLADCLVNQKAGIHYYAKQFIERVIQDYPEHKYFLLLESSYGKLDIEEIIVETRKSIPLHFRLRSLTSIPKAVNNISPDLVIEMAHFGPFRLKPNIKRVTVIHDLTPVSHPQWHDFPSHIVQKMTLPGILKRADYLICNSQTTKANLLDYQNLEASKIHVCYPNFREPNESRIHSKRENYFLSVGTIEPRKNYITLVKAFEKFAKHNKDFVLKLVGKIGWKSQSFLDYVENSKVKDRIKLLGYVEEKELESLYATCHAFIYPTLEEGFGMPQVEAMRQGALMIVSDIAICKEVCANAAIYFKNNDPDNLTQLMQQVTADSFDSSIYHKKSIDRASDFTNIPLSLEDII